LDKAVSLTNLQFFLKSIRLYPNQKQFLYFYFPKTQVAIQMKTWELIVAYVFTVLLTLAGVCYVSAINDICLPMTGPMPMITNVYTNAGSTDVFVNLTLDSSSSIHEMKIVYASVRDHSGSNVFEFFFNQEGAGDFNPSIIDGQFTTLRLGCNCTLSGFYTVKIVFENGSFSESRFTVT
jgi:hypothetical protein